jgi:pimeloyl-ACP methyl ester carboxylesterase
MTVSHHPTTFGFFDEGAGEPVILLHSSLSSRKQWRKLQQHIGGRYRLLGLDLLGFGDTPFPADPGNYQINCEVDLLERLLERVEGPVHLVGHSYGGAVALKAALRLGGRVRSVYAHEPVLFALLKKEGRLAEWEEIKKVSLDASHHVQQGRHRRAAEGFIDYWSGPGAWQETNEDRKASFERGILKVTVEFRAISSDSDALSEYAKLTMPVLLTAGDTGAQTGRAVAELLSAALPNGSLQIVEGAGHMAPIADAGRINAIIAGHLAACAWQTVEEVC